MLNHEGDRKERALPQGERGRAGRAGRTDDERRRLRLLRHVRLRLALLPEKVLSEQYAVYPPSSPTCTTSAMMHPAVRRGPVRARISGRGRKHLQWRTHPSINWRNSSCKQLCKTVAPKTGCGPEKNQRVSKERPEKAREREREGVRTERERERAEPGRHRRRNLCHRRRRRRRRTAWCRPCLCNQALGMGVFPFVCACVSRGRGRALQPFSLREVLPKRKKKRKRKRKEKEKERERERTREMERDRERERNAGEMHAHTNVPLARLLPELLWLPACRRSFHNSMDTPPVLGSSIAFAQSGTVSGSGATLCPPSAPLPEYARVLKLVPSRFHDHERSESFTALRAHEAALVKPVHEAPRRPRHRSGRATEAVVLWPVSLVRGDARLILEAQSLLQSPSARVRGSQGGVPHGWAPCT